MASSSGNWLKYLKPTIHIDNFNSINIDTLKFNNIKLIICDIDNTLVPHFSSYPTKYVINFCKKIQREGIILVLASNNTKKRVKKFTHFFHHYDEVISFALKPFRWKIDKILRKYSIPHDSILVIGDQFITDIWLANRLSCKSILVLPMLDPQVKNSSSSFLIKLLEKMIYKKFTRDSLFSVDDSSNFLSDSENSYL